MADIVIVWILIIDRCFILMKLTKNTIRPSLLLTNNTMMKLISLIGFWYFIKLLTTPMILLIPNEISSHRVHHKKVKRPPENEHTHLPTLS